MAKIRDWRWWVVGACLVGGFSGVLAAGYFVGQWGISTERSKWADERSGLLKRFPVVRAEERAACTREYQARIDGLAKLNEQGALSLAELKRSMDDTHEVVAYMLRYMGDRAKVADARSATLLKQTREAVVAATAAQKTTAQVEQKVDVAVVKADEAASTVKAVDRKLDTATHPALPPKPWVGGHRQ